MNDYILLMHSDARDNELAESGELWERYLGMLRASGNFEGGSTIGVGALFRKGQEPNVANGGLNGYLRVRAKSLDGATCFLTGNPVYEAGGTVELRELPKD